MNPEPHSMQEVIQLCKDALASWRDGDSISALIDVDRIASAWIGHGAGTNEDRDCLIAEWKKLNALVIEKMK